MHTDIKAFHAMFIHIYKINIVLSCSLAHNRYFQYPDRGERKGGKKNTMKNKMADKDRGHKITFSYFPRILIRLYLLLPCAFSWEYSYMRSNITYCNKVQGDYVFISGSVHITTCIFNYVHMTFQIEHYHIFHIIKYHRGYLQNALQYEKTMYFLRYCNLI